MKLMRVKKMILAASLSIGCTAAAFAQGPYLKLGAGYQFGMGGSNEFQRTSSMQERVKVSYGKGVVGNAGIGYMFNENLGAELGIGYLASAKTNTKSVYGNLVESKEFYSRMLLLQPSFIISAGREGLNPYGKFGLVAAKGKVINIYELNHNGTLQTEEEFSGGWGLGLQAALGLEIDITDQLGFFTEVSMSNLSYAPDKRVYTKYSFNGNDLVSNLNTRTRETVYLDEYDEDVKGDNQPRQALKRNLPFSSVGVNLGLKFNF